MAVTFILVTNKYYRARFAERIIELLVAIELQAHVDSTPKPRNSFTDNFHYLREQIVLEILKLNIVDFPSDFSDDILS